MSDRIIKEVVREGYARIARLESTCCATLPSCCGNSTTEENFSKKVGYSDEELQSVPEGANLSLGCGNPTAFASLRVGDVVLDLGSGAGFDCFLAANKVGRRGKVIGVDMTPEMIERALENARKCNYENVEFRLGEIENLPVADNSVDVVISNCVINLSPEKKRVFMEAFRVLKPGGRLMVSDIVLLEELPDFVQNSVEAYIGCLSGAIMKEEYIGAIKAAGFQEIKIVDEALFPIELMAKDPTARVIIEDMNMPIEKIKDAGSSVSSIKVQGIKPLM